MACTAIYGGIFAARAESHRFRSAEKLPSRSLLPAIRMGAVYGILFLSLAFGPPILAQLLRGGAIFEQLRLLQKFWLPTNVFELFRRVGHCISEFVPMFGFLAFTGFFLGASGGALAGAILEARNNRKLH